MLDFCEIVVGVLVKGELAKPAKRHLLLWPDLGEIEDVPAKFLRLLWAQYLDVTSP